MTNKPPLKLGIIGKNGAGKSEVCHYLITKGFTALSLSDIVRQAATQNGLPLTRENLILTGSQLKATHGMHYLAEESLKKSATVTTPIIFDSIRHPSEAKHLQANHVRLIGIDAPIELRYQRITQRGHSTDHIDFDTFKTQDDIETQGKSSGQNLNETFRYCTTIIQNDSTPEALHHAIDTLLETFTHATA